MKANSTFMFFCAICVSFLCVNSAYAEQKMLFSCEKYQYNASKSECAKKCSEISWDISSFMEAGWRVVTVVPNKEIEVEAWSAGGDPFADTFAGFGRNDPFYKPLNLPPAGCTCIGNQYIVEK